MKSSVNLKWYSGGFVGFCLLVVFMFKDFLFNKATLLYNSDQIQSLGTRYMRDGFFLTQWDDSRLGGIPTIDAMFGDAYHPLVFLQEIMDPARAVGYKFVISIIIAYLAGSVFFGRLTKKPFWGVLLGALYALSPHFFSHVYPGHDGKMMVMSVIPFALYGVYIYLKDRKLIGLPIFSAALVWMLLSSHLQMTYFVLWGISFWTLFLNFKEKEIRLNSKIIRQLMIALALTTALAISSIQIIPPYVYTKSLSVRGSDDKTGIGHAVSWSLHQEELASVLLPEFIGALPKGETRVNNGIPTFVPTQETYWGHNFFKLNSDSPGTMLLLLGFLGLVWALKRKDSEAYFWMGATAIVIAYVVGAHTPIFQLFYSFVPGVKNFRAPSMVLFWLAPILGILAAKLLKKVDEDSTQSEFPTQAIFVFGGLAFLLAVLRQFWNSAIGGLDTILVLLLTLEANAALFSIRSGQKFHPIQSLNNFFKEIKGDKKIPYIALNSVALVLFFISIFNKNDLLAPPYQNYFKDLNLDVMAATSGQVWLSVFFVLLSAAVIWYSFKNQVKPAVAFGVLMLAALIELVPLNQRFIQVLPRADYIQPENPYIEAIKSQSKDTLNDYRVVLLSRQPALSGNILGLWGMRGALGFHDNELQTFREFRGGTQSENLLGLGLNNNPFLDLLNVGFLVVDQGGQTRIMKNTGALDRTQVYFAAEQVDSNQLLNRLKANYDYRNKILFDKDIKLTQKYEAKNDFDIELKVDSISAPTDSSDSLAQALPPITMPKPQAKSRVISNPQPDRLSVEVESDKPGILMISNNYHPFWKAWVNGQQQQVLKAFGTLQAVEIPAGKSTVELKYISDTVEHAKPFVYIGLVLWAGLLLLGVKGLLLKSKVKTNEP